jgi:hypothetical protein
MELFSAIKNENISFEENGECHVKQNKPDSGRKVSHAFTQIQNLNKLNGKRQYEPAHACHPSYQEAEMRRIQVQSQARQIVHETQS